MLSSYGFRWKEQLLRQEFVALTRNSCKVGSSSTAINRSVAPAIGCLFTEKCPSQADTEDGHEALGQET